MVIDRQFASAHPPNGQQERPGCRKLPQTNPIEPVARQATRPISRTPPKRLPSPGTAGIGQAVDEPASRPRTDLATQDVIEEMDAIGPRTCQSVRRPRRIDRASVPERNGSYGGGVGRSTSYRQSTAARLHPPGSGDDVAHQPGAVNPTHRTRCIPTAHRSPGATTAQAIRSLIKPKRTIASDKRWTNPDVDRASILRRRTSTTIWM